MQSDFFLKPVDWMQIEKAHQHSLNLSEPEESSIFFTVDGHVSILVLGSREGLNYFMQYRINRLIFRMIGSLNNN